MCCLNIRCSYISPANLAAAALKRKRLDGLEWYITFGCIFNPCKSFLLQQLWHKVILFPECSHKPTVVLTILCKFKKKCCFQSEDLCIRWAVLTELIWTMITVQSFLHFFSLFQIWETKQLTGKRATPTFSPLDPGSPFRPGRPGGPWTIAEAEVKNQFHRDKRQKNVRAGWGKTSEAENLKQKMSQEGQRHRKGSQRRGRKNIRKPSTYYQYV